ncbi:MAG: hypothetical protein KF740_13850 [Ramlibacter sp.]|nr:hypothetical protein [Ramlibacter sp.]
MELQKIACSYREKSEEYADLPSVAQPEAAESGAPKVLSRNTYDVVSSMLGRFKAEQTRLTNSVKRKLRALEGLTPDDLRMLGASDDMLAQLIEGSPFASAKRLGKKD